MNIEDVKNRYIKISPRSITVKNENGKTCGVVRDIRLFKDVRPYIQMQYFQALRKAGIWGCKFRNLMQSVIISDGKCYYMHNLTPIENYKRIFESESSKFFETEKEHYKQLLNIAEEAKVNGIEVIPCYL